MEVGKQNLFCLFCTPKTFAGPGLIAHGPFCRAPRVWNLAVTVGITRARNSMYDRPWIDEAALVPAARAHAKECVTQSSNQNQFVLYMDWMNYYYCAFQHSSSAVRVANAKGFRPERHRCILFVHEKFEVVLLILEPAGLNHASRTVRLPRDTRTFFWQVVGHSAVVIEIFS